MLGEADAAQDLGALVAAAALEVVVDMETPSMARHLVHRPVEMELEWLHGA